MSDVRVTPQSWLWVPRTKPIKLIEIHATRGSTAPEKQKSAALYWVRSTRNVGNRKADGTPDYDNPKWGSSFSYVIGTDGSMGTVLNDDQMPTYSAGFGGPSSTYAIDEYGISYELAQSAAQEPFMEACYQRAAKEVGAKCKQHSIPPVFLAIPSQTRAVPTGFVRHDRCQNGLILGKTDPGNQFNEGKFIALVRAEMEEDEMPTQEEFDALKGEVNQLAGDLNGAYSQIDWLRAEHGLPTEFDPEQEHPSALITWLKWLTVHANDANYHQTINEIKAGLEALGGAPTGGIPRGSRVKITGETIGTIE